MMTPHTSARTSYRSRGLLLAGALLATTMIPVRASLWKNYGQAAIGTAAGLLFAATAYSFARNAVSHEKYEREQQYKKVKEKISELRRWVYTLQQQYEDLPIAQFEKEADQKIAEVREFLSSDLATYRGTLSQKMKQLNAELARLQSERGEMLSVLENQRAHFDQAAAFIGSVQDHDGNAYLNDVVAAKQMVERQIAQLHDQQRSLASDLSSLNDIAISNAVTLNRQEDALRETEATINKLNNTVAQRRLQVEHAARASNDAVVEADRIRTTLQKTQQETRTMKGDLDLAVTALNQYLKTVQGDYQLLDDQVRSAKNQLLDVSTRMASLKDSVTQQGSALSGYTTPTSSYSSSYSSSGSSFNQPQASSSASDSTVAKVAVQTLQRALAPFSALALADSSDYHKAYHKFVRRNHPDRGGSTQVFQAVDGLYKVLEEKRLFNRVPSYLPPAVRSDLLNRTSDLEVVIDQVKQ